MDSNPTHPAILCPACMYPLQPGQELRCSECGRMWTPDEVERFWSARLAAIRRARRRFVWAGIGFAVWAANLFLGGWHKAGFSWRNPMGWVCVFLSLALACLSAGALVWLLKFRRPLGPIRETAVFVAAKCAFAFGVAAGGLGAFFLCIQLIMLLW